MSVNINETLLYGASGHSKVICSIFEAMKVRVDCIFDDYKKINLLDNYKVLSVYSHDYKPNFSLLISIGDNKTRKKISERVFHSFSTAIHPTSIVDKITHIDNGTAIFHGVIIQRDVKIGKHCIINTNASIDHECKIDDFVHIAPSATLCGNIQVGEGTLVGANATILPNIQIGKWCIIGAGAVITKNIPDHSFVCGVPGKIIKIFKNDKI
jgi:sugar O-acyltransferase (sialic acid O-acetyltransferase NeuD family)